VIPTGGRSGRLGGRLVALGICGSIAAYKAVELLRLLQAEGADVAVLMTQSATRFVAPLTLEALSRHAVESDVLALMPDGRIGHVALADAADAIVVAPATAHWLGMMANGIAGDVVTATCLASAAPVVVAPAMDGEMYAHPATRANVARLRDGFGYRIVPPASGALASGQTGVGRLAELASIVDAVVDAVGDRPVRSPEPATRPATVDAPREADLAGRRIVVTAGGTAEPIDPVRFIGNRSSGRMGAAIAEAALDRGADVTLIVGLTSVPLPARARVVRAESASAMRDALLAALAGAAADEARWPAPGGTAGPAARGIVEGVPEAAATSGPEPPPGEGPGHGAPAARRPGFDALVMAAAVADFRPLEPADSKLARGGPLTLRLEPTPDILGEVARIANGRGGSGAGRGAGPLDPRPVLVGFAAETGSLARAPEKLRRKGVDLLVANDVAEPGSGFGTETNRVTVYSADGEPDAWPLLSKREVADRLLDLVARRLDERDAARETARGPRIPQETAT
jgi:phosphopantothenoylcysteine decarboxylase/phosphopantothenate--cysteine ligase